MSDGVCGYPTDGGDGPPCQLPPSKSDDRCHHHTDTDEQAKEGRPRERPSKEQEENIASVIESGGSIREACRRANVHPSTFYSWMEYGQEEPESAWGDFRERLVRARGEGEGEYRQALLEIAKETGDTATLMSMLKQRYPESWGDVDRGEQAGGVVVKTDADDTVEIDPDSLEIQE